jgi:dipeptidyl-peptidase 4
LGLGAENFKSKLYTPRLINVLIKTRKPYDLMLFPDERYFPRSLADRIYMEERISDFFLKHLT